MTTGIGLDSVALGTDLVTTDTGAIANMTTAGTTQVSSIDPPVAAPHITGAPVHTTTTGTLPTVDLLLAATPPEMTAGLNIAPDNANTNKPEAPQQHHKHHLTNMKTRNRNLNRLPLTIHPRNNTAQTKVKPTLKMI